MKMNESTRTDHVGWVMELTEGNYLKRILEGGDFIDTEDILEAKVFKNLENIVRLASELYFSEEPGYPKFHKVRLTMDVLDTCTYDDIA